MPGSNALATGKACLSEFMVQQLTGLSGYTIVSHYSQIRKPLMEICRWYIYWK